MASSSNHDYGKKGIIFGKIIIGFLMFLLLIIYVYRSNFNDVPGLG